MLEVLLGMYFFDCLSIGVLVVFCEGGVLFLSVPLLVRMQLTLPGWLFSVFGMMVLGFPVLRVPFGIWVPLQRGLVLESWLQCFCLIYVSHLIFLRGLYFLVSFSFHFWSLSFSHSFGHPLNLILRAKTSSTPTTRANIHATPRVHARVTRNNTPGIIPKQPSTPITNTEGGKDFFPQ